jgi:hypothetical protein
MLHEPPMVQVAVIGLALLCVVVLFVAARCARQSFVPLDAVPGNLNL